MDREKLHLKLRRLYEILNKLYSHSSDYDRTSHKQDITRFIEETFALYIAIRTDSSIKEEQEFQEYLKASAILLPKLLFDIDRFFVAELDLKLQFTFYSDEWVGVCLSRSAIESIREIYQTLHFRGICLQLILKMLTRASKREARLRVGLLKLKFPLVFLLPTAGGGILMLPHTAKPLVD